MKYEIGKNTVAMMMFSECVGRDKGKSFGPQARARGFFSSYILHPSSFLFPRLCAYAIIFHFAASLAPAQSIESGRLIAINQPQSALPMPEVVIPTIDLRILEKADVPPASQPVALKVPAPPAPQMPITETVAPIARTLESELLRQLHITLPGTPEDVEIEKINFQQDLTLPAEPWEAVFQFRLPQRGVGNVAFTCALTGPDQATQRITGSLTIDRIVTGVQTERVIRRGEPVGPGDLKTLRAKLSQLPPDAFPSVEFLDGTVARSELRPGVWLTGRMLELPTLVKSRQAVTMRLVNGPIHITAKGIAKQNGGLGEIIRIENITSKREVLARVISKDAVEVIY